MPVKIFGCQRSIVLNQEFRSQVSELRTQMHSVSWPLTSELLGFLVGPDGIEPSTSPLSGVRSSHLSYGPKSGQLWWSWSGSNRRPPECKSGALPAELQPLNPRDRGRAPAPEKSFTPFPRLTLNPRPLFFNRGQLDAGTRESSPLPLAKLFHTLRVEKRDGLTTRPEGLMVVYGVERLSSTGSRCTLKRFCFQKLHPRSLLERR